MRCSAVAAAVARRYDSMASARRQHAPILFAARRRLTFRASGAKVRPMIVTTYFGTTYFGTTYFETIYFGGRCVAGTAVLKVQ